MAGEQKDSRVRMVTVHRHCDPELRKVIQKGAKQLGLEAVWYGPTLTILDAAA